jgi:hypothetical protein
METAELVRMAQQVSEIDPSALGARQADELVASASRLANAAQALAARTAVRVGETQAFRRTGDRSEAHHLARVSGTGLGAARNALEVLAAGSVLASTEGAYRSGDLSLRQATAITGAALADRRAESRLLRMAAARSIGQLEDECARVRAAAAPDDEAERQRRARAERGAWARSNRDGSAELRFRSTSEEVAEVWSIVSSYRDRLFRDRAPGSDQVSFDQRAADGFLDMARAAAAGTLLADGAQPELPLDDLAPARPAPQPAKIIVRVDLASLLRGYPSGGEVCEVAGYGPVPVAAVKDMMATGNPFLAAVVTKGKNVATVAHLGREPSAHQQTALEWLDPRCRAEGCDRTVGLERDHRVDWSPTQVTLLGWLEWLCTHHHDLKTTKGWRLVHGTGIRAFVPPDDPRHPSNSPPHRGCDPGTDSSD